MDHRNSPSWRLGLGQTHATRSALAAQLRLHADTTPAAALLTCDGGRAQTPQLRTPQRVPIEGHRGGGRHASVRTSNAASRTGLPRQHRIQHRLPPHLEGKCPPGYPRPCSAAVSQTYSSLVTFAYMKEQEAPELPCQPSVHSHHLPASLETSPHASQRTRTGKSATGQEGEGVPRQAQLSIIT